MSANSIVVTVIIPVYNDAERLKLCLQALENQTFATEAYEVLVVDNRSTVPLAPVVAAYPHAVYLYEERQGSYAARNLAIAKANGDIFAFTDSDCIPTPTWIERGVAALRRDDAIGLIGGRIQLFSQDPDHPTPSELFEIIGAFQQRSYIEDKHYGATANVFTTRHVMEKVGLFDASMQSGGDKEWGQRVFAAGYRQVYAEDSVICHPARRTLAELRAKAVRLSEARYKVRKTQSKNSLARTLIDIVVSFIPPKRTVKIYLNHDVRGLRRKSQVVFVILYMRYFYARQNLRHLWNDVRAGGSSRPG